MKLTELLFNQRITLQLNWNEQKIEFFSEIVDKDDAAIYVTPYIHRGGPLELNVTGDKNVVCNIYADNPTTNKRVSWKGVELTTINRNDTKVYCVRTRGFNHIASHDDRRYNERIVIQVDGLVYDGRDSEGESITVRDISDTGISFYAPGAYAPKSQQIIVKFSDSIEKRTFDIRVECTVTRINKESGRTIVGCRLLGNNKDYQIYELLKRLRIKSGYTSNEAAKPEQPVQLVQDPVEEEK